MILITMYGEVDYVACEPCGKILKLSYRVIALFRSQDSRIRKVIRIFFFRKNTRYIYMYIYIFQEIHKAIFQYSGLELCVSIVFLIVNLWYSLLIHFHKLSYQSPFDKGRVASLLNGWWVINRIGKRRNEPIVADCETSRD